MIYKYILILVLNTHDKEISYTYTKKECYTKLAIELKKNPTKKYLCLKLDRY